MTYTINTRQKRQIALDALTGIQTTFKKSKISMQNFMKNVDEQRLAVARLNIYK